MGRPRQLRGNTTFRRWRIYNLVSVTAEGLFLHRNGLGNYLHQYIAATPERRKQLRLSIVEPEIAVQLREGPTKRIDDSQLPSNEYSYLRSEVLTPMATDWEQSTERLMN